tara:strand:- start:234 stop:629 length:396 start_codon:yes stop_codon:yes gene_type:complete
MSWREVLKQDGTNLDLSQYPDYDGTPKRTLTPFEQEMVEQNKKGDYKVRVCENCGVIQHRGRPVMYDVLFTNLRSTPTDIFSFGDPYCDVCVEGIPKIDSDGNKRHSIQRFRRNDKMDEESNRLIQDMRGN